MSSVLPKKVTRKPIAALVVIAILTMFIAVSALPRYFSSWPWSTPLKIANQSELQALRETGLDLPGWQSVDQLTTKLSGNTWSIQELAASESGPFSEATPATIALLLRPQIWEKDQPEVEWLDIEGAQRWQTDSRQRLRFGVSFLTNKADADIGNIGAADTEASDSEDLPHNQQTIRISADFFRAWSKEQTYAVMQWYASPVGGSPSPAWWFWSDQKAQWSIRQRLPWVAVSIWLPIEPLGSVASYRDMATALGKSVQTELLRTVFPETMAISKDDFSYSKVPPKISWSHPLTLSAAT